MEGVLNKNLAPLILSFSPWVKGPLNDAWSMRPLSVCIRLRMQTRKMASSPSRACWERDGVRGVALRDILRCTLP